MDYPNHDELERFLGSCEKELFAEKNMRVVVYPAKAVDLWGSETIKAANAKLLNEISGSANVYAIFTAEKESNDYSLKYIGQTHSKYARTRLTNHLIKKNAKTGAQLKNVMEHVQARGSIKISWISITPESLRHFVEEKLIELRKGELTWNQQGKK